MSKGKNYVDSSKIIDKSKVYDSAEAMKLVVETAKAKFEPNNINSVVNTKKVFLNFIIKFPPYDFYVFLLCQYYFG